MTAEFKLPAFIPADAWEAFVEMRKAKGKRAPFTDKACERMIKRLGELDAQGHDIEEALWQSVRNGWSDVYPPKGQQQATQQRTSRRESFWSKATGTSSSQPFQHRRRGDVIDV